MLIYKNKSDFTYFSKMFLEINPSLQAHEFQVFLIFEEEIRRSPEETPKRPHKMSLTLVNKLQNRV